MKKILASIILLIGITTVAYAAPSINYQKNVFPEATDTYELGTSSLRWLNIFSKNGFFENITITGSCTGAGCGSGGSGGATSTNPLMATYMVATSTTATSTLPQLSTSVFTSLWGSFTRLFVSGLSANVGDYVVVGANGELVATSTPQVTTIVTVSGTRNDSNVTFTTASEPILVVVNGQAWAATGGAITWSYSAGTITLSQPVGTGGDIYGISLGTGLIAMVADPYTFYVPTISGDATAVLQAYINRAAALATSTSIKSTVIFPATSYSTDALTLQPMTTLKCNNTVFKKRSNATGSITDRSMLQTLTAVTDYGESDNITVDGCTFDSDGKTSSFHIVQISNVRKFIFKNNVIIHSSSNASWALSLAGQDVDVTGNKVLGGQSVFQDGFHFVRGNNIRVSNNHSESGDDAYAIGRDISGTYGVSDPGPDEGLSNIVLTGNTCNSAKARCVNVYYGQDFINAQGTFRRKIKSVIVDGLSGTAAQTRGAGVSILNTQEADKVYYYRINAAGSGYTDGSYEDITTTGGTCSTQPTADVTVSGGAITLVILSNQGGGTYGTGDGCDSDVTLVLTGLGAGAGGSVTGYLVPVDNSNIENIVFDNVKVTVGSSTAIHDGANPYLFYASMGKNVRAKMSFDRATTTSPSDLRIAYITSLEDAQIELDMTASTSRGFIFDATSEFGTIDNVTIQNSRLLGHDSVTYPSDGIITGSLGDIGDVYLVNNDFSELQTGGIGVTVRSGVNMRLHMRDNKFSEASGATGTYGVNVQSATNNIDYLYMENNDFRNVDNPANGATTMQNAIEQYNITNNVGYLTEDCQQSSIASGATSTLLTVGTRTGLSTSNAIGMGHIRLNILSTATTTPYLVNVSTTTYRVAIPSPALSTIDFVSCEDTTMKPIN